MVHADNVRPVVVLPCLALSACMCNTANGQEKGDSLRSRSTGQGQEQRQSTLLERLKVQDAIQDSGGSPARKAEIYRIVQ